MAEATKERRDLSGIFFRVKRKDGPGFENRCFEDLSEDAQDKVMSDRDATWLRGLAKLLARSLNDVGMSSGLTKHNPGDDE
jgi:hypothetical protein